MPKRQVTSDVHYLWHLEETDSERDTVSFTHEELEQYDNTMQALRELETMIEGKLKKV